MKSGHGGGAKTSDGEPSVACPVYRQAPSKEKARRVVHRAFFNEVDQLESCFLLEP
jgi:hypothetical protein